ncbi:MAG: efflux RND transporter permease subunit [bacterium]
MNIAKFSVNKPVTVTMGICALVLLGTICAMRLPVDLLPKVTLPTITVSTTWPNVAPEEIESQITRPIEQAVSSAPNLYTVSSTSSEGSSRVNIQFNWGTDMGQAAVDVLQLVERAKRRFPSDDAIQTPIVSKNDPNSMPILNFGVSGENDPVKLRSLLDNQITPMLESCDGVASATASGGLQRAILVNIDPVKLNAHHLTMNDVIRRISAENINQPAGIAKQGDTEYTIRSLGWLTSLDALSQLPISSPGGQTITLNQVAEVRDEYQEQRTFVRLNGAPAAGISITKQSDANTITTAKAVYDSIEKIKVLYPNLDFKVAYDQSKYISTSILDVQISALVGGILAVLLILFFLRNLRSTLVIALSIPISIISTFALLYICGFSINTMSLSGLALATGLIVDDAVVILENIFRHIERDKKPPREAAVSGSNEVIRAVMSSTWTVMVVFLPLLLIKGQSGQMFSQFALVVIFSIAISLISATTVVPMLTSRFVDVHAHVEEEEGVETHRTWLQRAFHRFGIWFDNMDQSYHRGLGWALNHRAIVLGGALGITLASLTLLQFIGTEQMPPTDSGDFSVNITLPVGTAISTTDAALKQVEDIIRNNPNVATVFATAGSGGRGGGALSYQGSITVKLNPECKLPTKDVMEQLRGPLEGVAGVRPRLYQRDIVANLMSGGDTNIQVNIFGDDLATLAKASQDVMARIGSKEKDKQITGLTNVDVSWQEASPEIQWQVDRQKANQLGVSFSDIAGTLNTATTGSTASNFQDKGFQYPIIVQLPPEKRKTIEAMKDIMIAPSAPGFSGGSPLLLGQLAKPIFAKGPNQITRQDRQRYVAITGSPSGRPAGDIQIDVAKAMAEIQLPTGLYWDWGTNQKRAAEEFSGMGLAIFLAIGLIYMLLASQFESFIHPFTVLLSVPLAATGVILAMLITSRSFGLTAYIGILMLVGIVVKNGILLVDYTNTLRHRGIERNEAILRAGPTRLRPILMTACAAILGMLPLAIGIGKGSETQAPMATAVIGGLLTSTFLTLFVVPVMYTIMDDFALALRGNRAPAPVEVENAE